MAASAPKMFFHRSYFEEETKDAFAFARVIFRNFRLR